MSTNTHELPAEEWHSYLDSFTEASSGMLVTAHVMDESLGDQTDIERLPLQAVSYDPRDDVLEVAVGGRGARYPIVFRHLISAPRRIEVRGAWRARPRRDGGHRSGGRANPGPLLRAPRARGLALGWG